MCNSKPDFFVATSFVLVSLNCVVKWVVGNVWSVRQKKTYHGTTSLSRRWCIMHCQASIPPSKGQGQQKGTQPE